ncbi:MULTISPECIES: class I SAM-dependent methyltransferase [unclassified Mesorhizobium]|uniref:class I SAM-dependent methyltransferase n=1 Tax=unclassified Mesorhizobium TaxID=325217 RepID=UPI00112A459A|nr:MULTISPECIES: class I SAM-dependent methyltransferase [unclassified Mesorhizobium]MBZ9703846.1 methyltransferase domain-containing protein [Mesorhizobium sp. CO1-1-3]MBZ9947499.1 methyltransferase domain-containing protein [Mesorhizobium sp. BR1-1-11]TPJ06295.1 methyltransferase domain-containing protein [Mesorhizobium sp. B2-8-1]
MAELFDQYRATYNTTVDDSISFSGLKHDFFLQAKVAPLARLIAERGIGKGPVRALDVGCGVGALHPYVKPLFSELHGCDISTESVARAREENPSVTYAAYPGPRLPYADGAFDLAFAVCVAHHVPPEQWPGFFAEMRRVVRRGGVVCVIEHNPYNPLTRLAVLRCPFDEDAVLISQRKAGRLLQAAGLTDIEGGHFLMFPFANSVARKVEGWLSQLPLGAQYVCSGRV